jgi:1-deoxy-D-xylulose-5-phosphate synthase
MTEPLLYHRQWPKDLKTLSTAELEQLAEEIRHELVKIGDACGGHLASNLGVVELTIALHTLLDSPHDKIVWDTSHQVYVHKMLTGRLKDMYTIRQKGGLSGFAKIAESEHDMFGAGHASTALSAALGLAHARDLKKENSCVVAVIGDASLSCGMAFEALNNAEKINTNFVCILNDNDMSISSPIGKMAEYLTKLRTSAPYNHGKEQLERIFTKIPRIGVPLGRRIEKAVERLRDVILDMKFGVIFEEFGFRYLGPIDGHNIPVLMAAIRYAKSYQGPILIHIITKKGKGHAPAEGDPFKYHGVSPKKPAAVTDAPVVTAAAPSPALPTYTQVFGETACEIARERPNVVVITPAMKIGSGLVDYAKEFPDRFFDVGIAEEHAVTFAGGLARDGILPIVAIYSTFLQRAYDQVVHDICLQKLPCVFAIDRGGLVGEDGPTHHGVFDYSFLLPIPNMQVLAPKDGSELNAMLKWAVEQKNVATAIRFPRGNVPAIDAGTTAPIVLGKAEVLYENPTAGKPYDVVLLAAGSMAWPAVSAAQKLGGEHQLNCAVINLRFMKPLDTDLLVRYVSTASHVVVLEEGCRIGGVFAHILESLQPLVNKSLSDFQSFAVPDRFIDHGKPNQLLEECHLTVEEIVKGILAKTPNGIPA